MESIGSIINRFSDVDDDAIASKGWYVLVDPFEYLRRAARAYGKGGDSMVVHDEYDLSNDGGIRTFILSEIVILRERVCVFGCVCVCV